MTDIVEKPLSLPRVFSNSSPIMKEAADTITALRTALAAAEERAEKAEEVAAGMCVERNVAESLVARFVEACGPFVASYLQAKEISLRSIVTLREVRGGWLLEDFRALASLTAEAKGES